MSCLSNKRFHDFQNLLLLWHWRGFFWGGFCHDKKVNQPNSKISQDKPELSWAWARSDPACFILNKLHSQIAKHIKFTSFLEKLLNCFLCCSTTCKKACLSSLEANLVIKCIPLSAKSLTTLTLTFRFCETMRTSTTLQQVSGHTPTPCWWAHSHQ